MSDRGSPLSASGARAFYDRLGAWQDAQGFYENPALDDLIRHAGLGDAQRVFEFGCGTGKLAARLLADHLPSSASYLGFDVSQTMVGLAARRLAVFPRAEVVRSDGTVRFPVADGSTDRVISTYVLDLLSEDDIRSFFAEAHRALAQSGRLCLVSLTKGTSPLSRLVSSLWMTTFCVRASLVGGCRPVGLEPFVDRERWRVGHRRVLTSFGVASEVVVLVKDPTWSSPAHGDSSGR